MALTRHGHHIENSPSDGSAPITIVQCGGPTRCTICSNDSYFFHWLNNLKSETEALEMRSR